MRRRRITAIAAIVALGFASVYPAKRLLRRPAGPNTLIDDLTVPADEILKLSPDVAEVQAIISPFRPTHRIIHIADRHYLSRQTYRSSRHPQSEEGYSDYAREVEGIQSAQTRLLIWLADQHGLREIFDEGIDQQSLARYRELIERGRRVTRSWRELMSCLADLRGQIHEAEASGMDATNLRAQREPLEKRRSATRAAGAVAQLLFARPRVEVLPAEDKAAFEDMGQALYVFRNLERVVAANESREEVIVRNLLDHGTCSVIMLGGGHDLSHQIRRLSDGRCEYVRVMVKGYPAAEPSRESFLYRGKPAIADRATVRAKRPITRSLADSPNNMAFAALLAFALLIAGQTFRADQGAPGRSRAATGRMGEAHCLSVSASNTGGGT